MKKLFGGVNVGIVVFVPILGLVGCSEDRCVDGPSRGWLEDTPPHAPCKGDDVGFSPKRLVFRGGSDAASGGTGNENGDLGIGEAGAGLGGAAGQPEPGTDNQNVAIESSISGARVAVTVKRVEGGPRSKAVVEIFECGAEPLLVLDPIAGRGCERIGASLRCRTDRNGSAEFKVTPDLSARGRETGICWDASNESEEDSDARVGVEVTIERETPPRLKVAFAEREVTVGGRFALGCIAPAATTSGLCQVSARAVPLRLRLHSTDCASDGECLAPAPKELRAWVSLAAGASGSAWLSTSENCAGPRSLGLETTFSVGYVESPPLYACVDGRAATHRVVAKLSEGSDRALTELVIQAQSDPIVVDVESVSGASQSAAVALRYETCHGEPLQSLPEETRAATLALNSAAWKISPYNGEVPIGSDGRKLEFEFSSDQPNPFISFEVTLGGNAVPEANRCSWSLVIPGVAP